MTYDPATDLQGSTDNLQREYEHLTRLQQSGEMPAGAMERVLDARAQLDRVIEALAEARVICERNPLRRIA
jgi:hypothetical protein